jgi:hypothetical protein
MALREKLYGSQLLEPLLNAANGPNASKDGKFQLCHLCHLSYQFEVFVAPFTALIRGAATSARAKSCTCLLTYFDVTSDTFFPRNSAHSGSYCDYAAIVATTDVIQLLKLWQLYLSLNRV